MPINPDYRELFRTFFEEKVEYLPKTLAALKRFEALLLIRSW